MSNYSKGKKQDGEFIKMVACTNCASSDALAVYAVREAEPRRHNATCFSCQKYEPNPPGFLGMSKQTSYTSSEALNGEVSSSHDGGSSVHINNTPVIQTPTQDVLSEFLKYPIRAIPERNISIATCQHFGVRVSLSTTNGTDIITHMYPYHKKLKLSGYNERVVETKRFFAKGDRKDVGLFGSWIPKQGKTLYITEGELDCMSVYEALRYRTTLESFHPAVVSLSHGAASAVRDIGIDFDYVNSFDKVVLVFDDDEPGQKAVKEVCQLLAGKVFVATLSEKDANAMLMEGKIEALKWAVVSNAIAYMPDNIVDLATAWDAFNEDQNMVKHLFDPSYKLLNKRTYGIQSNSLILVTSGTGMGKTQLFREFKYHFHQTTSWHMGEISLEETLGKSMSGLMALHLNKRLNKPDVHVSEEEKKAAFDHLYATGRWAGYDFCGGLDDDTLFSKIRWMAASGKKVIWLDHLSIIISEFADQGDERQRIDAIMTKLARMCKELDICIFLIVHLKKTSMGLSFEEGAVPNLDDLRGSGTLKQLPDLIIALSRNQQHTDPMCANTSLITVLKNREIGDVGPCDYLHFQPDTGRMVVVPEPPNYHPPKRKPKIFNAGEY